MGRDRTLEKLHEQKGHEGFPPATHTHTKGLSIFLWPSLTLCHSPHQPPQMRGFTYIFFNVLGLHSLVGIICGIEGAKYKPGEETGKRRDVIFADPV